MAGGLQSVRQDRVEADEHRQIAYLIRFYDAIWMGGNNMADYTSPGSSWPQGRTPSHRVAFFPLWIDAKESKSGGCDRSPVAPGGTGIATRPPHSHGPGTEIALGGASTFRAKWPLAPITNRCQSAGVGGGQAMVLLREHGIGALGTYTFEHLPRIGDTINVRQADKNTYFQVADVEHVITDPGKSADTIVVVKRVVRWPG